MKIYLAAPIHRSEDAERNRVLLEHLRDREFDVWSPQEAGIASIEAKDTGCDLNAVRKKYMRKDLTAMKLSDVCLAYVDREQGPSQGMLWEMGWCTAMNKIVIIYNPGLIPYTLMAEFTADYIVYDEESLMKLLEEIDE